MLLLFLVSRGFGQLELSPPDSVILDPNMGQTVTIPLNLSNPDSDSIKAFGLTLHYPSNLLQFDHCDAAGTLTAGWTVVACQESESRVVTVGGFHTTAIAQSGVLLNAVFEVVGETGEGLIQLSDFKDHLETATTADGIVQVGDSITVGVETTVSPPAEFQLYQNYPNPFNPETRIRFDVPSSPNGAISVHLTIFSITGQLVRVLVDERRTGGPHVVVWNGRNDVGKSMPSGLYLYKLSAGSYSTIRRMLLLK
ncbi:MAG: cohesin domain-containing protein [Calditrichaeota bacterium]|nr:cohesin domain-containing protein [Calditrichota bacterium]